MRRRNDERKRRRKLTVGRNRPPTLQKKPPPTRAPERARTLCPSLSKPWSASRTPHPGPRAPLPPCPPRPRPKRRGHQQQPHQTWPRPTRPQSRPGPARPPPTAPACWTGPWTGTRPSSSWSSAWPRCDEGMDIEVSGAVCACVRPSSFSHHPRNLSSPPQAGCTIGRSFFRVETCAEDVGGGFRPPDGVILCHNHLPSQVRTKREGEQAPSRQPTPHFPDLANLFLFFFFLPSPG